METESPIVESPPLPLATITEQMEILRDTAHTAGKRLAALLRGGSDSDIQAAESALDTALASLDAYAAEHPEVARKTARAHLQTVAALRRESSERLSHSARQALITTPVIQGMLAEAKENNAAKREFLATGDTSKLTACQFQSLSRELGRYGIRIPRKRK